MSSSNPNPNLVPPVPVPPNLNEPSFNSGDSGSGNYNRGGGFNKGGGGLVQSIIIAVVCSIAVVVVMVSMLNVAGFVTQKDFTTNTSGFATKDQIAKMQSTVDGVPSTIQGLVNKSLENIQKDVNTSLQNSNTAKSTADTAKNTADSAQSVANTAKSIADKDQGDLVTLKQQVADLTVKVNAVPTPTPTPTSNGATTTADGLYVNVRDLGTELLAGAFNFTGDQSIKLTVKNTSTIDITDLRIYIDLIPQDYNLPSAYIDTSIGNISLGGDLSFSLVSSASDDYQFRSGRISIQAGKTKNYYLTPAVTLKRMSTYPYIGNSGTPALTNTGTDTPYTSNSDYLISRLQNDLTFEVTYDVIDYNVD